MCAAAAVIILQTGLFEMKEMVQLTGGQCVQIDSFTNVVFKDSLKRMFARYVGTRTAHARRRFCALASSHAPVSLVAFSLQHVLMVLLDRTLVCRCC